MNNKRNKILAIGFSVLLLALVTILTGCYSPYPLYGKWGDNAGSTITFKEDYTFDAEINLPSGKKTYQGEYSVQSNVLSFSVKDPNVFSVRSEWDVRGAILCVDWKDSEGEDKRLILYRYE